MAGDLLARIVAELAERQASLRPAFDEHEQLLAAMVALGIDKPPGASARLDAPAPRSAPPVRRAVAPKKTIASNKRPRARKAPIPERAAPHHEPAPPPPPPPPPEASRASGEAQQAILAA